MNNKLIPLDCDDVVLLGKDTFKVSRLKDLIATYVKQKLQRRISEKNSLEPGVSLLDLFRTIPLNEHQFQLKEIRYSYDIKSHVLKIGSQGWQQGKLKIDVHISSIDSSWNEVDLEFYPEEKNRTRSNTR
jgi:hypothetical protein